MSMSRLKATERQLAVITSLCQEHSLPTSGQQGIECMSQLNEKLKDKNPDGYQGVKAFLDKSFEYIRKTKS